MSEKTYMDIPFPACFFLFSDFLRELKDKHGIDINDPSLQVEPGEIFQAFHSGNSTNKEQAYLKSRYPNDPPEFITLMHGSSGGLHWGYYLEDPQHAEFFVVSYFHREPLFFSIEGLNLFEALRRHLEKCHADHLHYFQLYREKIYREYLKELDVIRSILKKYDTSNRPEKGMEYFHKYSYVRNVPIQTRDGLGINLPATLYRSIRETDPFLIQGFIPTKDEVEALVLTAKKMAGQGLPGAALKLGKDLWCYDQFKQESFDLLELAYKALNRTRLLRLLGHAKKQYKKSTFIK